MFNVAYGARTIKLFIRGEQVSSDVPVQITKSRAMVPLRLVAEELGEDVRWDDRTGSVYVGPDLWEQDLRRHISRNDWVYARNIAIRFLIAFLKGTTRASNWSVRISVRISSVPRSSSRCRESAWISIPWSISNLSTRNGTPRPKS